jgi:DNA-binding transcriptional MerR regulator
MRTLTINEVARATGITSRTLRHYDAIGLLRPSEVASNGYRLYDTSALIRLQRILALRDLGMSLARIQSVMDKDIPETEALAELEHQLLLESARLNRQIASVRRTLESLMKGEIPMANDMFDGFDHNHYKEEVEERRGTAAWQTSSQWWNDLGEQGQQAYQHRLADLIARWKRAYDDRVSPDSDIAQGLAHEQVEWLRETPGPHTTGECPLSTYIRNLGEMYVNDPRFAANYGGEQGAMLVRDALNIYADTHLSCRG